MTSIHFVPIIFSFNGLFLLFQFFFISIRKSMFIFYLLNSLLSLSFGYVEIYIVFMWINPFRNFLLVVFSVIVLFGHFYKPQLQDEV